MTRKNKWKTKVGRDCVSLDTSLARWLSARLLFLSEHGTGVPVLFMEELAERMEVDTEQAHALWKHELAFAGVGLERYSNYYDEDVEAAELTIAHGQNAMRWVAKWLPNLWD